MIDEKKLIEDIRKCDRYVVEVDEEKTLVDVVRLDDVKRTINEQPKTDCFDCSRRKFYQKGYQDGLNADKWISCEERLPELDEGMEYFKQSKEYLVTVQWWDEETNVDIGWYNQNGMWSNDSKNCKVIAWLPIALPQPYKKEGAE